MRIALDGTIAELNPAACRFLAPPREALIGAAAPAPAATADEQRIESRTRRPG